MKLEEMQKKTSGKLPEQLQGKEKNELEHIIRVLEQLSHVEGDKKTKTKAFNDAIAGIKACRLTQDKILELMIKGEENWFFRTITRLLK